MKSSPLQASASSGPANRRVLIVSPAFVPLNTPDMQRVRMSLSHYREFGWDPIVLTVDPDCQTGIRDDLLEKTLPDNVVLRRCGAWPLRWCRRFGVSNLGLRAWFHLLIAGAQTIRRDKVDLVFFSTTQFITFTLGRLWLAWRGVPYVIDLQDPWVTDYYRGVQKAKRPGGWKYAVAQQQARLLEPWVFRKMAGLMAVSPRYLATLAKRYRWFSKIPSELIGFGASETDLEVAKKSRALPSRSSPDLKRIVYTGAAGPIMHPSLGVLLDGLNEFRATHGAEMPLRIEFLGTSYAPPGKEQASVAPLALPLGLADVVSEKPARLGHLEALAVQGEADALLLLGSDDPDYAPSKLYPYFLTGRPILAVVPAGSNLEQTLAELNCARIVTFGENGGTARTREELAAFFSDLLAGMPAGTLPARNEAHFRQTYLSRSLVEKQCALFDRAVALPPATAI
jgi:hypothetical protein